MVGMWNPGSETPWNPAIPVEVTPEEYERQVLAWLRKSAGNLENFHASHLHKLEGRGGEYEFDIVVEFSILGGAGIIVLVECKRYIRPVEREKIQVLHAKIQDVGAHKGMIFSTSGFQKGAIDYATEYGIATITFIDGASTFETKGYGPRPSPPPWMNLPRFAGNFLSMGEGNIQTSLVDSSYLDAIKEWLAIERKQDSTC